MGLLDAGSAHISTLAGVTVNLTTKNGAVVVDWQPGNLLYRECS